MQIDVVGDQHQPAALEARLMPPAALVNTMERTPSEPQHAHAESHLRGRIAFVEVGAAGHHGHVERAELADDQFAGVAHGGGRAASRESRA